MAYYYDHQAEIDRLVRDEEAEIQVLREASPSALQAKLGVRGGD